MNGIQKKVEANLTKDEQKTITTLLKDTDIVIRPADKGSGEVVVDTKDYIENLEGEVIGNNSYRETDGEGLATAERKVKSIANKMLKEELISRELTEYLVPKHPESGTLRGNPKIHKKGNPYRTTVNGIGTVTERIVEVCEKELNDYVESTPVYIRDTTGPIHTSKLNYVPNLLQA